MQLQRISKSLSDAHWLDHSTANLFFHQHQRVLLKTIKANGYSKTEKSFGHVSTKSKALEEQRGFDFMHNIVTGGNKYMKRNRAKEMLASELHSFTDKVCLYMSNEYIAVETESSVSKKRFGWCPGISNLPTQIR